MDDIDQEIEGKWLGIWSLIFLVVIALILILLALALPGKNKEPSPPENKVSTDYINGGGNEIFNQLVSDELMIDIWYLKPVIDMGTYKVTIYPDEVLAEDLQGNEIKIETITNFKYANQYIADFGNILLVRGSLYIFANIDGEYKALTTYDALYKPVKPLGYQLSFNVDTMIINWITEGGDMVLFVPPKLYSLLKNVPEEPYKIGDLSQVVGNRWSIRLPVIPLPNYNISACMNKLPNIYYDYLRGYIWGSYGIDEDPVNLDTMYKYIWLFGWKSLTNHIIRLGLTFPDYRYLDLYWMKSLIGDFGNFEGNLGKLFNIVE